MSASSEADDSLRRRSPRFQTTRWSLVSTARGTGESSREALGALCEAYWDPLYAYVRRRGYPSSRAEDLTQGFFAALLERQALDAADRRRGRFRTFLLTSLQNYLANEWHRSQAQKRGGDATVVSLDRDEAERRYAAEPASDAASPEALFDRRWALAQLERALERLQDEMEGDDRGERFRILRPYLTGEAEVGPYAEAADTLGISEAAVKMAVHRMRRRFGTILRQEVAETVASPADAEREIRHLFAALGA